MSFVRSASVGWVCWRTSSLLRLFPLSVSVSGDLKTVYFPKARTLVYWCGGVGDAVQEVEGPARSPELKDKSTSRCSLYEGIGKLPSLSQKEEGTEAASLEGPFRKRVGKFQWFVKGQEEKSSEEEGVQSLEAKALEVREFWLRRKVISSDASCEAQFSTSNCRFQLARIVDFSEKRNCGLLRKKDVFSKVLGSLAGADGSVALTLRCGDCLCFAQSLSTAAPASSSENSPFLLQKKKTVRIALSHKCKDVARAKERTERASDEVPSGLCSACMPEIGRRKPGTLRHASETEVANDCSKRGLRRQKAVGGVEGRLAKFVLRWDADAGEPVAEEVSLVDFTLDEEEALRQLSEKY